MTLTTAQLKAAIEAKIAAASGSTTLEDLTIIKRLADTWLANNSGGSITGYSSLVSLLQARQNALTGSSTLDEMVLAGVAAFPAKSAASVSYVGEMRMFNTGVTDLTMDDGSRWLRAGFYETNPAKWDSRYWPYSLVTAAPLNTGWSVKSGNLVTVDREIVVLKSGKKIAFPLGGITSGSVFSFSSPTSAPTIVKSAAAVYVDYSYDWDTDTLWLLQDSGQGLTKITADGTTVTEITAATYAGGNTTAKSIHAKNGKVFIGLQQAVRFSTNNGTSWAAYNNNGLPSGFAVGLGYNEANDTLFGIFQSGGSNAIFSSATTSYCYSTANGNWVLVSDNSMAAANQKGAITGVFSIGKHIVFSQAYVLGNAEDGYLTIASVRLFDTETKAISMVFMEEHSVSYRRGKVIRINGKNQIVYVHYNQYNGQSVALLYDFDVRTNEAVGASSSNLWSVDPLNTNSKAFISGYVDAGKLIIFRMNYSSEFVEKTAFVGAQSINGFSHVRIS